MGYGVDGVAGVVRIGQLIDAGCLELGPSVLCSARAGFREVFTLPRSSSSPLETERGFRRLP